MKYKQFSITDRQLAIKAWEGWEEVLFSLLKSQSSGFVCISMESQISSLKGEKFVLLTASDTKSKLETNITALLHNLIPVINSVMARPSPLPPH